MLKFSHEGRTASLEIECPCYETCPNTPHELIHEGIPGKCNGEGEFHLEFPATLEVCHRCEGRGTHVNEAIDGNGLTARDFDEDPDFRSDYMSGLYDVTCTHCQGRNVAAVIDWNSMSPEQTLFMQAWQDDEAHWRAVEAAERRMGC